MQATCPDLRVPRHGFPGRKLDPLMVIAAALAGFLACALNIKIGWGLVFVFFGAAAIAYGLQRLIWYSQSPIPYSSVLGVRLVGLGASLLVGFILGAVIGLTI